MEVKPWNRIKVVPLYREGWAEFVSGEEAPFNLKADIKAVLSGQDDIDTIANLVQDDLRRGLNGDCLFGNIESVCCLKMRIPIDGNGKRKGARAIVIAIRYEEIALLVALRCHHRGNNKTKPAAKAGLTKKEEVFVKKLIGQIEREKNHEA